MNHDSITPAQRLRRLGPDTHARLGTRLHASCARIAHWLRDRRDRGSVVVSVTVLAILLWLSIEDIALWILGLPPR